jgi:hypothetical protein
MIADNYSGNIAIQHNPANLADSRFRFNMNVVGFNAHLQNNYIQLETPHSIYKFLNWKWDSTFGTQNIDFPFKESYATERLNGRDKYVYANASINAFSMQFALADRAGISFAVTTKAYGKVSNLPENAIKTFLQDLDNQDYIKENQRRLLGQTVDLSKAGAAALAYQQYSLKYAMIAKDRRKEFIKIGFGIDYNLGLYGGYFKPKDINYTLTGIDTLLVNSADMEIAYIDPAYTANTDRRLNDYWGKSRLGRGLGINAGIVYEHRPDSKSYKYKMDRRTKTDGSQNKYDWKIAASIIDLGFVNFSNGAATRKLSISAPKASAQWENFDSADSWNGLGDLDSFTNSFFSVKEDSGFTMYTPASLQLSADYKVRENIYISANYAQSLIRNNGKSVRMPNVLSIAPRYESRWLTIAIPISVSSYYNKVNLGTYIRGGIFYIGSDNLGGFLTGKKTNGANVYGGLNWPIHYRKLEDLDGDGISDEEDKCPDMPGTHYTDGCPDSDGDKVADNEDKCPNKPGRKSLGGCPDSDGDGVSDLDDKCPEIFGGKKTKGCPDSDGDGLHDGEDDCPEVAGELKYKGCIEPLDPPKIIQPKDTLVKKVPLPDTPKLKDIPKVNDTSLPKDTTTKVINRDKINKFDNWDFVTYEYWPVLGAYNDVRWAEELQTRLNTNLNINATLKTIPGVSKYYVTLGQANSLAEALAIQKTLDIPKVNKELNGTLWWKKVVK